MYLYADSMVFPKPIDDCTSTRLSALLNGTGLRQKDKPTHRLSFFLCHHSFQYITFEFGCFLRKSQGYLNNGGLSAKVVIDTETVGAADLLLCMVLAETS